jgi:hypothetical protein
MKNRNTNNMNLVLVIGILCVIGCVCPPPKDRSENKQPTSTPIQSQTNTQVNSKPTAKAFDYEKDGLQLVSSKWEKGGFGAIAIWKVTIKNVSDKPLGDIKFSTEYFSETKNSVGKGGTKGILGKDIIQKVVPPKSTKTFEVNDGFVIDDAVSAEFLIESWRVIE